MSIESVMIANAKKEVIYSTSWLSELELSTLAGMQSSLLPMQLTKWKDERDI
jgi:hypothetical protein